MMAVILAGGKGLRLKPYTMVIPKPLLPVGEIPILEVMLRQLAKASISKVVMTLGHMDQLFVSTFGDGSRFGLHIEYCREEEPLGTAGPLRLIPNLEDNFFVMNGDLLTTIDFADLYKTHINTKSQATIAVHQRTVFIDYGVIEMSEQKMLQRYVEKPQIPYHVSMGINVLSCQCLEYIPKTGKFDMPALMTALQQGGKRVRCYQTDCYWQDIGRFDDYLKASEDFVNHPEMFLPREK